SQRQARKIFDEQIGWAVDAGVDFIVGETYSFGGEALLALEAIKRSGTPAVMTLAVPREGRMRDGFTVSEACKRLQGAGADVIGLNCGRGASPDGRSFPTALDPLLCSRYEIGQFGRAAFDLGVRYLGVCCGAGPHHIRSLAEALGRKPAASRYSPDMSKHILFGSDKRL